ncbi:hypothetical protein AGOR_G00013300 [Albula goreensis]|uniref:Uncharacterized protein n=1 Tax=Albula goreensis TaxID=1534307 RepID=A0A8T3E795_9TELE|nr:hypothetical protein AGOR_G00013300 [Albula goreensis]
MEQLLPNTASTEVFSDIPPPQGFADREYDLLDELSEDIASCQISSSDKFEHQEGGAASGLAQSEDMGNNPDSGCPYSPESSVNRAAFLECLSASDTYDSLFLVPRMPVSRSSYTKQFINNHDGTRRLRNNSIAILETKSRTPCGFEKQAKRRQTFPGPTDYPSKMPEGMPNFRESFSSGTLSSFFLQSLPLQAERVGRFYMDDERSFPFSAESRKSSESSTSNKASSGNFTGYRTFLSNISAYGNNRNPFYPSGAGESQEEVSVAGQHAQRRKVSNEVPVAVPEISPVVNSCMITPDHGFGNGHLEHSEVAESGFDEEMVEAEELNQEFYADELTQRNLFIHVTPPSPSNSEELIIENSGCQLANLGENSTIQKPHVQETSAGTETPPKRRRGSVMTIIIGGCEQRSIQNDAKPLEAPEGSQRNVYSGICEAPSVSPVQDIDEVEADANSDMFEEEKSSPQRTIATESSASSQISTQGNEIREVSGKPAESQGGTENGPLSQQNGCHGMDDKVMTEDRVSATNGSQDSGTTDTKPKLQQTDSIERRSIPRSPTELKFEAKEHLRPPADPILKDQEDVPDHWAKRRKLFKESKQWSSAGGSSLTSNITEESVNSEDGRSVDISVRDIEDRGFYTETFHSASWIYRGDDIHPSDSPRCLSNRPRPVTMNVGNQTVFRVADGAAEEAGLLVGDSVLAVNGTDVTSVPHSEAADLARQGPDILTLTIGSDISRCPNTPRPACRGYLHKRTQSGLLKGWRKRWFVLKHDCCLYYYRHKRDEGKHRALSSMKLEGAEVGSDTSLGKPFVFKCNPVSCARVYYFCATSNQEMKRWLEAMERAIHPITQNHVWIDVTRHNSNLPPLAIKNPECLGLLHQMDKSKDVWVQHYCILKDGCLYFYAGIRSTHAMGGIFLHGYTVREQPYGSRRSTIELKPPSEEFKTFHLCAENATENKRWILALKASISKWLLLHQAIEDYMNRPSEETRM